MAGRFSLSRSRGAGGGGDNSASAALPRVDAAEFETRVVEASRTAPVIVDFVAPWCRPCIAMEPVLAEIAARFEGSVSVLSVDIQDNPDLAAELQILSIPLLAAYSGGEQVGTLHGAKPKKGVTAFIEGILQRQ